MATRWTLDTCACVLEYENEHVDLLHLPDTPVKIVNACSKHAGKKHHEICEHHWHRNRVLNWITDNKDSLGLPSTAGLIVNYDPKVAIEGDLVIIRDLNGHFDITTMKRLQDEVDQKFGKGRARVKSIVE